jgi:subtilisin-like proprotein convertase family protein
MLHDREDGGVHNLHRVYDVAAASALAGLIGQAPAGIWKLEVHDHAKHDVGKILSFAVELEL